MLISETALVKWNSKNIKYYTDKGYKYTKMKEEFDVKIEDLPPYGKAMVKVLCDYCLEEGVETIIEKPYSRYVQNNINSLIHKDTCADSKCSGKKIKEVMMIKYGEESIMHIPKFKDKVKNTLINKYGVDHPMKVEEFKNKAIETSLLKYGVINPLKSPEVREKIEKTNLVNYGYKCSLNSPQVREKIKQTNLDRYGYEYIGSCPEFQEKIKQTNLEKYGVEYALQSLEIQDKIKHTNLERYGYENPLSNPEIQAKTKETLYKNNIAPTSLTQLYIYNILKNNNYNVELNYPVKTSLLDIVIPDDKIYIEYDGSGHDLQVVLGKTTLQEFKNKQQRRWYALRDAGWKEIRIISKWDYIPLEQNVLNLISYAIEYINSGHSWIEFIIHDKKVRCSQFEQDYIFGKLIAVKNNSKIRKTLEN